MSRGSIGLLGLALLWTLPLQACAQSSTPPPPAAAVPYTPVATSCPRGSLIRSPGFWQQLNAEESSYISTRETWVLPGARRTYLQNVEAYAKTHKVSLPAYVSNLLEGFFHSDGLRLGIATSGGGYRAAMFGGGVLNALDGRNSTSVASGTGGLLQTATYLTGLSGGGWLVSSLTQAGFPLVSDLIFGGGSAAPSGGWITEIDLLQVSSNATTQEQIVELFLLEIAGKAKAGFPVTITDVWARSIARHFVSGTTAANFLDPTLAHGAGVLWSDVTSLSSFSQHAQPFPILIADTVSPNQNNATIIPGEHAPISNPLYEFTPYEFGSYDPSLASFIPTKFLGSHNGTCYTKFDQTAYIAAAASNIFNQPGSTAEVEPVVGAIGEFFPEPGINLYTAAVPNPFLKVSPHTYLDSNQPIIQLVDGGEDGEVVPIQPLLVRARGVDVIIAIDAAADTDQNYANGQSLIATAKRAALYNQAYSFPKVPSDPSGFAAQNLTTRPAFFGCDNAGDAPLVIYLANGGPPLGETAFVDTPTSQGSLATSYVQSMLDQSFDVATQGIPTGTRKDPEWPVCLACAVVDRAREKAGQWRQGVCEDCMKRYCWTGN